MPRKLDLSGRRFGRLTVIAEAGHQGRLRTWHCRCVCGRTSVVATQSLTSGNTASCGCGVIDAVRRRCTKHGAAPRAPRARLYRIWKGMRQRCNDPNAENFSYYGGRGIRICAEWDDYQAFERWATGNGYAEDLTIDRQNNDGDYTPGNCRWVDRFTQMRNTRRTASAAAVSRSES